MNQTQGHVESSTSLLGTCSQMLRIKNKATQNVKCQYSSSFEALFPLGYNDLHTKVMKDIPSFIVVYVNKRRSIWNIRDNINNHITLLIHSHYIIMERHKQYWITNVPSAWWKVKVQAWCTSRYRSAWIVREYCSPIYRHGTQPMWNYIHALYIC